MCVQPLIGLKVKGILGLEQLQISAKMQTYTTQLHKMFQLWKVSHIVKIYVHKYINIQKLVEKEETERSNRKY